MFVFLLNILGKRSDLPFSRKSDRKKEKSAVSCTHEQNIICSQTQMDGIAYEQTIIWRQLFAGHVAGFRPMKRKKISNFFLKSKMATIVGDVTGLQQRHHPIKYISSCREDQRLSTEGQIVSKYCNILKTLGRVSINPPPLLVPRWGYEFACASEGYFCSQMFL